MSPCWRHASGVAVWLIYKQRSRRGLFWLSIFSLAYFGFWRKGCICAIGAPQNIILGLFDAGYTVPLTVIAFFALPLVVALFAGRAFCAGGLSARRVAGFGADQTGQSSRPGSNTRWACCRSSFSASGSPSPPPARAFSSADTIPSCRSSG